MTKKEAKIKALEYIIECNHAYAELCNDSDQYSESSYDKVMKEIEYETNLIEKKLNKLKL